MTLKGLVHRSIKKTDPEATLGDAARMMGHYKIGSLLIEDGGHFVGIITEGNLVRKGLTHGVSYQTPASAIMDAPLISIDIHQSPIEANHLMHLNGIRHLAVQQEGVVVGVLSVRDLVRHFASDADSPLYRMRDVFQPLTALMQRNIQGLDRTASVQEAAQKMASKQIGALVVTQGGRRVGLITETDLVRQVIGKGRTADVAVSEIMNAPILGIDLSRTLQEANDMMAEHKVRHLAVTEKGEMVGILSVRDLIGMISLRDLPRFVREKGISV
jgi:CBS domain-containing protein